MRFGPLFADELANLKFAEAIDDQRTHDQAGEKSSQAGKCCAECEIAKNAEGREVMEQLDEQQPIKQRASKTVVGRWLLVVGTNPNLANAAELRQCL